MIRIDDLIKKHCPDGVEYTTLRKVAARNSGTSIITPKMKVLHYDNCRLPLHLNEELI